MFRVGRLPSGGYNCQTAYDKRSETYSNQHPIRYFQGCCYKVSRRAGFSMDVFVNAGNGDLTVSDGHLSGACVVSRTQLGSNL